MEGHRASTGSAVPEYRLYQFKAGRIERVQTLAARDDAAAVRSAAAVIDGRRAELWRGAARLQTFRGTD
jgi:hypothetical protein